MSLTAPSTRPDRRSLRRRLVMLAERATTPLLPADYLDLFDPLRPGADLRGRIVEIHPETSDAATIVIRARAQPVSTEVRSVLPSRISSRNRSK